MNRILIIEDDVMLREDLAGELKAAGYTPLMVLDFADCVKEIAGLDPDLIL